MALLTRALQKIFGSTGGTGEFGQIGSKAAGAPATTKNLETMQALSEYDLGLNAIVSDQGTSVLPYLEDINSLFFLTTSQLAYLFQSGTPEWDDATEYYQGVSLVLHDGDIWIDTYGTVGTPNLNFNPTTNTDKWTSLTGVVAERIENIIFGSGKGLDFSADTKGVFKGLEAIVWRLNTNIGGPDDPLGSTGGEWEIADDVSNEFYLGQSDIVSEANGIWTFKTTGYYLVLVNGQFYSVTGPEADVGFNLHTEIGAGYVQLTEYYGILSAAYDNNSMYGHALIKVTDIAHTLKLVYESILPTTLAAGYGDRNGTNLTFIKLADI